MAEALTIDAAVADAMPNADATVRDALESAEAGADAREEAAQADLDEGTFEVVILYADRELPDVQWRPARPDAGADDADGVDANASPPDAGNVISLDSGIEAASSPCAAFNTSVGRDGGPTGTPVGCSATEQRFVDKSIDCYTCLVNNSCLDDAKFGDTDNECEDLVGAAHSGDRASQPLADICLSEIDCVLATHCAATDTAGCYCGTLAGGACATSKTPANGACAQTEVDGLDEFITTPASVIAPLQGNRNLASGRADGIFACAVQSGCSDLCNK